MTVELNICAERNKPGSNYAPQTAFAPVIVCDTVEQAKELAGQHFPGNQLKWAEVCDNLIASEDIVISGATYSVMIQITEKVFAKDAVVALPTEFEDDD